MSITSANAVLMLGARGLFDVPQKVQGFAADDVYDSEANEVGDTMQGVDGILSGGLVLSPVTQGFSLMADSPSADFFDTIAVTERSIKEKYVLFGTIYLPGLGKKFAMPKGFLINYPVLPDAKKLLQPRKFLVRWQSVDPAPV